MCVGVGVFSVDNQNDGDDEGDDDGEDDGDTDVADDEDDVAAVAQPSRTAAASLLNN